MVKSFSDYDIALRTRDLITNIAENVVNRLRPADRIGEVYDYNLDTMTALVLFPGSESPTEVRFGRGQQPYTRKMDLPDGSAGGDLVRVAGTFGNYYIAQVMDNYTRAPAVNPYETKFWQEVFTLTVDGAQDLILDYEPTLNSEHVYWGPLYQEEGVDWTRVGFILSLLGSDFVIGDKIKIEYAYTDPAAYVPPLGAPTGLSVTPGETTLSLSWTAATGATGYEVRINAGSVIDSGSDLTHLFTGLSSNTQYTLEVRAYNETTASAWVSTTGTTTAASYSSAVLALNPLLYWRLGETSGTTATDSSGNSRHGTYVGPTVGVDGLVWNDVNKAASFDGVNDRIEIADAAWMDVTTFSIAMLVKRTGNSGSPQNLMIRVGAAGNYVFAFRCDSGIPKLFIFNLGASGTYDSVDGPTALQLNTEYHVACSFDDATNEAKLYVDGALVNTKTLTATPITSADAPIAVGGLATGSDSLTGVIDEVALFGTVIAGTDFTNLYEIALVASINDPRDIDDLKYWYSPEYEIAQGNYTTGQQLTTVTDLSGLNNHATAFTTSTNKPTIISTGGPAGGAERFRFDTGYIKLPAGVFGSATAIEHREHIKSDFASSTGQGYDKFGTAVESNHFPYQTDVYDDFGSTARKNGFAPSPSIDAWRRLRRWSAPGDWGYDLDGTKLSVLTSNTVSYPSQPTIGNSAVTPNSTATNVFKGDRGGMYGFGRKLKKPEDIAMREWQDANPSGGVPV